MSTVKKNNCTLSVMGMELNSDLVMTSFKNARGKDEIRRKEYAGYVSYRGEFSTR